MRTVDIVADETGTGPGARGGTVLLAPVLNSYDILTTWGRRISGKSLVDCGDHVEWRDGPDVSRWLLPDQAGEHPDRPVLARVVQVDAERAADGRYPAERHLLLVSSTGRVLARLGVAQLVYGGVFMDKQELARVWPLERIEALADRGVAYEQTTSLDLLTMTMTYPGAQPWYRAVFYSNVFFFCLLLLLVAMLVTVLLTR